jgi:peptidoglycan/xylan/chitin deacetylase (PgdA/CDA1 family)
MKSLPELAAAIDRRVAKASRTKTMAARNTAPIVSITFDDIPASAARVGADILEARGVRGSFYICGGLDERPWENGPQFGKHDIKRLSERGHEIGCHTFEHLDCARASAATLMASLERNQAYVQSVLGDSVLSTFAYPYGSYGTAAKRRLQRRFAACRGVNPGINAGTIDLGLLKSVAIPNTGSDARWIAPWLTRIRKNAGWLILVTHDVQSGPGEFGCAPAMLSATVDAILAEGIEILPLKNAIGRIAFGSDT